MLMLDTRLFLRRVLNVLKIDLTVDLRDAMGDRLFLTGGFRRDGVLFDVKQATALKYVFLIRLVAYYSKKNLICREHAEALSSRQAIAQSRKSRGLFDWFYRREESLFAPSYEYKAGESACRISGTLAVKRVTGAFYQMAYVLFFSGLILGYLANLHITTLGHGYASFSHVDHNRRVVLTIWSPLRTYLEL